MHTSERQHTLTPQCTQAQLESASASSPAAHGLSRPPGTLSMYTTVTSGSWLDATVLTSNLTGAAATMHGQLDGANGCQSLSVLCRGVLERQVHLCIVLGTAHQPATWSCRAGCSYIAAMAWLTTLRLLCLAAAEAVGCGRPCSLSAS
jgi:hypothetical protein